MSNEADIGGQETPQNRDRATTLNRRDLLIGTGAGLLVGAVAGVGFATTRSGQPAAQAPVATPQTPARSLTPSLGEAAGPAGTLPGIATIAGPVQKRVTELPPGPLFWRVETFPTVEASRPAEQPTSLVIDAERKGWMFTLASQGSSSAGGTLLAEVGPVPAPAAAQYLLQLSYQTRAPQVVGSVHSHPGVESWYVVEGEQTVLLPTLGTELVARGGEGLVGPTEGIDLQILNTGTGARKAFNMFVLDAGKPATNEGADIATIDAAFKKAFADGDLDATMDLFAEETVEISPFGIFPGRQAIRASVETFIKANPGFEVTFDPSEFVKNTAVHRVLVTSDLIRGSGISRFALIQTLVVTRGKITMLGQQLDLTDPETAQYALGLAPEGR